MLQSLQYFHFQILETALQHILKTCTWEMDTCRPISNLTATVVLALAENVERPTLLPFLEQIVAKDSIPVEVRVKAVLAIRPLVKIAPTRVSLMPIFEIFNEVLRNKIFPDIFQNFGRF